MGETISLTAEDGFTFSAYRADPEGTPKGSIVVIQEIFGVNSHIRSDTDKFAKHGYVAVAPAPFDRIETGVELGYNEDGIIKGRALVTELEFDRPVMDIRATADYLSQFGKVGSVGYCWGGTMAWLAATRIGIPSVGYYGGRTIGLIGEQPKAPVLLHFGEKDASIPLSDVDAITAAHPDIPAYVYDAGHGFNCDQRADYDEEAAALALERTLAFFSEHIG